MDALHSVLQTFDRLFPQNLPTKEEFARWAATDAADAARADYIKQRTPELVREYQLAPTKLAEPLADALDVKRLPAFFAAYIAGDDLEAMRLLRAAATARLQEIAEDAAEDESYLLIPEPQL
jgi:hypothetical protein